MDQTFLMQTHKPCGPRGRSERRCFTRSLVPAVTALLLQWNLASPHEGSAHVWKTPPVLCLMWSAWYLLVYYLLHGNNWPWTADDSSNKILSLFALSHSVSSFRQWMTGCPVSDWGLIHPKGHFQMGQSFLKDGPYLAQGRKNPSLIGWDEWNSLPHAGWNFIPSCGLRNAL